MDSVEGRRKPVFRISYGQLEAYIMLPLVSNDENYTLEEVVNAANENNIVFGIDYDILSDMIKNRNYGKEVLFAKGQKAIDGQDGCYEFNFDYDLNRHPKIREDGSVDYWSIHSIEVVKKGQIIARYIKPVEGRCGKDVHGREIPAKRGKEMPPLVGRGFEKTPDGLTYTASIDGKIEKHKNRILILPILEINGDVDVGTGNIDFIGDVLIHGNIKVGAYIRATQSVTVDGIAEACTLEAGKDIILRGGMIGSGKARIIAKGNLYARFMEYTYADITGFVEADSAVNCTIISTDKVLFNKGHASIVGGSVYGCAGIEVEKLGNDAFIKTEVHVGVHKKLRIKIAELERNISQQQQTLDSINVGIKQIEALIDKAADTEDLEEKKMSLVRVKIEKSADIKKHKEELGRLQSIVERSADATVKVLEEAYPNVEVWINNSKAVTKEQVKTVEFVERSGKVVIMSMM